MDRLRGAGLGAGWVIMWWARYPRTTTRESRYQNRSGRSIGKRPSGNARILSPKRRERIAKPPTAAAVLMCILRAPRRVLPPVIGGPNGETDGYALHSAYQTRFSESGTVHLSARAVSFMK